MVLRSQIFFSSNFSQQYSPLFEILFGAEVATVYLFKQYFLQILASLFLIGVIPFFIYGVFKECKIHRNIRLIVSHIWFRYGTAIVGRLILIYYQIFEISWTDSDDLFTVANIMRGSFTGYLTSFLCCIAFERLVATLMWNWYERQGLWTIFIALMSLSIVEVLGQFAAYAYAYELLSIQKHYMLLFGYACGSTICIAMVCALNMRIMKDLKRGARLDSYSIHRTYQIKENLEVIEKLVHFVGPTIILNIPCFVFYGMYAFLPETMNTTRYFGAEFYDLSTVTYGLTYVIIMMFLRDRVRVFWSFRLLNFNVKYTTDRSLSTEGDVYFMQLSEQFKRSTAAK